MKGTVVAVAVVPEKGWNPLRRYKYVLHLDFDYPIPDHWLETWKRYKSAMLETMGFQVERIILKDPKDVDPEIAETVYKGRKSAHVWVHITSPSELNEDTVNMLQWLLCDDGTRVWINQMRIDRGLEKYWNKLFTRAHWIRPLDKKCNKCKIRQVLNEMRKEHENLSSNPET